MATTFIYPTDTRRVTSDFRTKHRPDHHGTDFADGGYHPIYAVADGKVTRSYRSTSYGECIMIEHYEGGQVWETVYAHMREGSRKVRVGERVKRGEVIGVMGNTGYSTGQHLHFELHKGKWEINKTDAVDPLDYLGKDLYLMTKLKANLKVDGIPGPKTISALQRYFGTPVDGKISKPSSLVVKALQKWLGVKQDGILGPITISALQKRLGTPVDGEISESSSLVIKELQRRLNEGKL